MITTLLLGLLFLLPIIVLWLRAVRPHRMPWWLAFLTVVIPGWALVIVLAALNETPDGGAAKVFALFFGWGFVLVSFAPWLLIYGLIQWVRRFRLRRREPSSNIQRT